MVFLLAFAASSGAEDIRLELVPRIQSAAVGTLVTYTIFFDPVGELSLGGGLDVVWDPAALELVEYRYGTLGMADFRAVPDKLDGRLVSLSAASFNALPDAERLATVTFRVLREGSSAIELQDTIGIGGPWVSAVDFGTLLEVTHVPALLASTDATYPLLETLAQVETDPAHPGDRGTVDVVVRNNGTGAATIDSVQLAVLSPFFPIDDFSIDRDGCSGQALAPRASCTITVAFAPLMQTAFRGSRASLKIASSDLLSPVTAVTVRGRTAAPDLRADSLELFDVSLTPPFPSETVTVTNVGTAAASIDSVLINNAANTDGIFEIIGGDCGQFVVDVGQSCAVQIRLRQFRPGVARGTLRIDYAEGIFNRTVTLRGYTPTPIATVDLGGPDEIAVGVGDSAHRVMTITNTGPFQLLLDDPGLSNFPFFHVLGSDCPLAQLDHGESCFIELLIQPDEPRTRLWRVTFTTSSNVTPRVTLRLTVNAASATKLDPNRPARSQ